MRWHLLPGHRSLTKVIENIKTDNGVLEEEVTASVPGQVLRKIQTTPRQVCPAASASGKASVVHRLPSISGTCT